MREALPAHALPPLLQGASQQCVEEIGRLDNELLLVLDTARLVVDDDPAAVELMSAYLRRPGFSVLRAYGGQDGIELARQHLPDLAVLDLLMPDISGIEVVEALKREPSTAEIPVIMVTAKQFSAQDREQLSAHVLSVIDKNDFRQNNFLAEVRRAFGRRPGAMGA